MWLTTAISMSEAGSPERVEAVDGLDIHLEEGKVVVVHGVLAGTSTWSRERLGVTVQIREDRMVAQDARGPFLDVPRDDAFLNQVLPRLWLPLDRAHVSVLSHYGAAWLSVSEAPPDLFVDAESLEKWQERTGGVDVVVGGRHLVVHPAAAPSLERARDALAGMGMTLEVGSRTPGARSYGQMVAAWRERLAYGASYWVASGEMTEADVAQLLSLHSGPDVVSAVLDWEAKGVWLNKTHDRSILTAVAPPGSSQHAWMMAVDLKPSSPEVVEELAKNGFFRTVWADEPHFTWLGLPEEELALLGLVRRDRGEDSYWVPDL